MPRSTDPTIGFVILSWNGAKLLEKCLAALKTQSNTDYAVCLVDNGSTDNTTEIFRSFDFDHSNVISNARNRGFAPAVNQGITSLLQQYSSLKYVVLLNNDVFLEKDWLEIMVTQMDSHADIGFAQGSNYTDNSKKHFDCTGIYIEEGFIPRQKTTLEDNPTVVGPNAAALIMSTDFVKDMSYKGMLLDETFFAYVEDVDLLLRAYSRGWKHGFFSEAHAIHVGSATGNRISTKKMYWGSRNLVWLVAKNTSFKVFIKKFKKISISRLADIQFLYKTNKKLMFAYIRGLLVGVALTPRYYLKHRYIMNMRKTSDSDLLGVLTPSSPPLTNPFKYLYRKVFAR